ncbi:hypothetical protein EJ06DRAFT_526737 [Trichodelitschia bisporula]|uniref:BTB domain-containing protein n=1 Tax=Trichodelitschia bisporula TaxID=703511 RepID=A0A6G1I8N2_9PEZI|nr:hypothetical protein EJ06DRAFT_526737 [Trichodelitschia bisporula]
MFIITYRNCPLEVGSKTYFIPRERLVDSSRYFARLVELEPHLHYHNIQMADPNLFDHICEWLHGKEIDYNPEVYRYGFKDIFEPLIELSRLADLLEFPELNKHIEYHIYLIFDHMRRMVSPATINALFSTGASLRNSCAFAIQWAELAGADDFAKLEPQCFEFLRKVCQLQALNRDTQVAHIQKEAVDLDGQVACVGELAARLTERTACVDEQLALVHGPRRFSA